MNLIGVLFFSLAAFAADKPGVINLEADLAKANIPSAPPAAKPAVHRAPAVKPAEPPSAPAVEPDPPRAKTVQMTDRDVVPINCARRYETLFILPPNVHIVEAGVGDPEQWQARVAVPNKPSNSLHVKPSIQGSKTNLNIRTDTGRTYTFALVECGGKCTPDMKVFIEPAGAPDAVIAPTPQEVALTATAEAQGKTIADLRAALNGAAQDLASFKAESEKVRQREMSDFRSKYALKHDCNYRSTFNQPPFQLQQICHDEIFTYIRVNGDTAPALYGEQDGKLSMLSPKFERDERQAHGGTLIVPVVLARGRLAYGSKKLEFSSVDK